MTFTYLGGTRLPLMDAVKAFAVGVLSDFWIAGIASVMLFLAGILTRIRAGLLFAIWFATLALVTAVHQGYVEFFGHQILPLHLNYIYDYEFLEANAPTAFAPSSLVTAGFAAFLGLASLRIYRLPKVSTFTLAAIFTSVVVLTTLAHQRNLHYRVQWFVPDQLQMHPWEGLHFQMIHRRVAIDLTAEEFAFMASPEEQSTDYLSILTRPPPALEDLDPLGQALLLKFQALRDQGEKPAIIIALMESQRPAETGFYTSETPSLTPAFDALAREGIAYTQAYGVSNVTRGAQEAVLCGYRGSAALSLMRGRPDVRFKCIPDLVTDNTSVLWLHGGNGRFDQQEAFWLRHGIARENILTQEDFPDSVPHTGWGVGDRVLIPKAIEKMVLAGSTTDQTLAVILSVTNHIPWALPDEPDAYLLPVTEHDSHRTTHYADAALGDLVTSLKKEGRWHNTLLLALSDHGNLIPTKTKLYAGKKHRDAYLSAHISLAIAGGIVESQLESLGMKPLIIEQPTSQAAIAPFIAALLSAQPSRYMAESLFSRHKLELPVLTDLGKDVFAPTADQLYKPEALKEVIQNPEPQDRPLIYFRAFLNWIDQNH